MKYFIDTEFLEGTQEKRFLGFTYGKTKPTIDLISIGIVSEDGREYYAVSKDFNLYEAWNRFQYSKVVNTDNIPGEVVASIESTKVYWIRENVLLPIYKEFINGDMRNRFEFSYATMKWILSSYGKSNKDIAKEIMSFTKTTTDRTFKNDKKISFYGYYADYDWVVFCWTFGKMLDLPEGFPMYCNDIKQELVNRNINKADIPFQDDKHHALEDARWNKLVYETLLSDGK